LFDILIGWFQQTNPGVKVVYEQKSKEGYEAELLRAFAAGSGPDVFSFQHTWLAKYPDIISAAPAEVVPTINFRESFVDVVQRDFVANDLVYGVPLYVDTLALYYNTDLFNSAGIAFPPKDWDEFIQYSQRLTQRKQTGDISISGAAFGGGKNVVASADMLTILMLQFGAPLVEENGRLNFRKASLHSSNPVEEALEFYTSFAKQSSANYSWSGSGTKNSEDMFAENKAGMMIGYASTKDNLLRKQARLNFKIAPLPQIKDTTFRKNYANYWGYSVYNGSKNKLASWLFLKFLSDPEVQSYYVTQTERPSAQKSIIVKQQQNEELKVHADQALSAVSWLQLDEQIITQVFTEMIETQISSDQPVRQTVRQGEIKLNSLLNNQIR